MVLDEGHPASISLQEYVECFLQSEASATSVGGKLVVKCNLNQAGVLRFSKVYRGGENKGENAELQLAKELRAMIAVDKYWARGPCDVRVICNKSPSIISADHFTQVLRQLRAKLGSGSPVTFSIAYAHPCHYVNQRALSNLHRAGIKLSILRVEDILSEAIKDVITDVNSLTSLPCSKLRNLRIEIDCMMLATAHFMLTNAFEIDGITLAERNEKGNHTDDVYVQRLRQELRKLQGISRGRIQHRQAVIERGRRSSSLDPYKQGTTDISTEKSKAGRPKSNKKQMKNWDEIPWLIRMCAADRACVVMQERSAMVLNAVENGNQEVSLSMEMYRTDYILNGGPDKSSKTKAVDGKWTIQCFTGEVEMFYQEQGLVLKNAYDDGSSGLSNPQLYKNISELLTTSGERGISIEIEILLTSLPDKNNFLKQAIQFAEKLVALDVIENIILIGYFAGMDTFTMPSKQALRKMLKIGENGKKTNKLAVALKPLHLQVILNMMMADLLVLMGNFHMVEENRGVKIKARSNELSSAMHLLRSSVKITNELNTGSITDSAMMHRLTDKHFKSCEQQLEAIFSTQANKG